MTPRYQPELRRVWVRPVAAGTGEVAVGGRDGQGASPIRSSERSGGFSLLPEGFAA